MFPVKVNHRQVPSEVMQAVWGFFSIYVVIFIFMLLALMLTGLDFLTSFSAVGATINNLGPGLGDSIGELRKYFRFCKNTSLLCDGSRSIRNIHITGSLFTHVLEKMNQKRKKKWNNYYKTATADQSVAAVLVENAPLLPKHGLALDLACGRGVNSFFLQVSG